MRSLLFISDLFCTCRYEYTAIPIMPREEPRKKEKAATLSLVVSIPRNRIHVVGMVVCDERVLPKDESPEPSLPASLPVSFPLSVFKDLKTSSVQ